MAEVGLMLNLGFDVEPGFRILKVMYYCCCSTLTYLSRGFYQLRVFFSRRHAMLQDLLAVWLYGVSNFQGRGIKLDVFLAKNQFVKGNYFTFYIDIAPTK